MEEIDPNCQVAGLLAYHLVNLVLQEGCMIANAALESGRPREYLATRANVRSDLTYVIPSGEDTAYVDTTVGNFIEGADNAKVESELITSTPQKVSDEKSKQENGQGDDYAELVQNNMSNSTSLFINHLFDISDVELGITGDAIMSLQSDARNEILANPFITNVMDFYVNAALDAFRATKDKEEESDNRDVRISGNSSFSYIEDTTNDRKDVVFYVDDEASCCTDNVNEIPQNAMTSQMALQQSGAIKEARTDNIELYEKTYLSLNRDFEQCSDEEEYPILEDPKGMLMQEIVLLTANTSNDTAHSYGEAEDGIHIACKKQKGDLAATSGVSASSRRSGLVQRWRLQGARVLACLHGWWRRKAPGKRKVSGSGADRGRPLSPSARGRAASLLDHRVAPAPTCPAKSNTINEALINSLHWMDYAFEAKPNDCGDV